jgi:hypothetical protein
VQLPGAQSVDGLTHCSVCNKFCYAAERLAAGGRLFHKKSEGHRGCFRCAHCDVPLSASNYSAAGKHVYCNVHFKQLFATTGDYRFAESGDSEGNPAGQLDVLADQGKAASTLPAPTLPVPPASAPDLSAAPPPSSRQGSSREGRELWPPTNMDPPEEEASPAETEGAGEGAVGTAAAAAAEEEEDEGEEATCYVYGDLRLPFAIEERWLEVRDLASASNYLVVSYSRSDRNLVEVVGCGSGGLRECVGLLADPARVYYGGLRVLAVDTRRGVRSVRPKFLFFSLFGAQVSTRERTRGLLDMGAIAEVVQQTHCSIEAEDAAVHLSAEVIAEKLLQSGGAHKPNAFDFGGGLVLEKEWY